MVTTVPRGSRAVFDRHVVDQPGDHRQAQPRRDAGHVNGALQVGGLAGRKRGGFQQLRGLFGHDVSRIGTGRRGITGAAGQQRPGGTAVQHGDLENVEVVTELDDDRLAHARRLVHGHRP